MTQDDSRGSEPDLGRRRLLVAGAAATCAGLAAISVAPGLIYLAHPLSTPTVTGGSEFVVLGPRGQFRPGEPKRVEIWADRVDAWQRSEHVKLGAVWVMEREGELVAFSTVCPHLGCAIDFDADRSKFVCPCHKSAFGLDGTVEEGPAPRPLDRLQLRDADGSVAVLYQRFRQNTPNQEPLG